MDKDKLRKYVQAIYPMPDAKACEVTEDFYYFSIPKGEFLLEENKVNKFSYFLEEGYVRSYTLDKDGNEVTTKIYSPPCIVNDFTSFFKQLPVKENFQTLTPCEGWKMTFENVEKYFQIFPEFREFGRLLVAYNYDLLNERMLEMIKEPAEKRYLKMISNHPDIFQNVSLKIIASYLGITDSSLSRIRKEILQR
jgi:CRP-like cAMP-binding protein